MARGIELARIFYTLNANTQGLERDLQGAQRQLGKLGDYILANPVAAAGALGVALVGIGVKAVEMAEQVEKGFRRLGALVPGLTDNMKQAQQGVAALAKETGRSQEELLATSQAIAAQGVENTEDLLNRLRLITNLAKVTGTETGTIAAGLDQVLDVFGLAADKAQDVSVRLFAIAKGKAPLEDLFAALQAAAPGIREAGLSFDVAAQSLATLLSEGKSPKQAAADLKEMASHGADGARALEALAGAAMNGADAFAAYTDALTGVNDTTTEKLAKMKQSWENFSIHLGQLLSGPVSKSLDALTAEMESLAAGRWTQSPFGLFERRPEGGWWAGGEPQVGVNGPTAESQLRQAEKQAGFRPSQPLTDEQRKAIAEQKKLADDLIEELRQKVAEFTATAVDDSVLALDRFLADMNEKLAKLTDAERAAAQPLIDLVAAGMRANTEFLRAVEAIKTTPTVVSPAAKPIALRTADKSVAEVAQNLKEAEKEAAKAQKQAVQDAQAQAQAIAQAAHGALQLADAFGIMSDNAAQALEAVVQIGSSVSQFSKLSSSGASFTQLLPSILSIAGGLGSLVGSLFGESPEQKRAREVQQSNTDAILELSKTIGDFGGKLSNVAGSTVGGVGEAARGALGTFGFGMFDSRDLATLRAELGKLDLTMGDLKEVAAGLGISFAGAVPTAAELKQLLQAIAENQLATFSQTFTGQLEWLQGYFDVFDITDPIEQLKKLADVFDDPKFGSPALRKALAGLDLSTPEGRAAAEKAVEELYKRLNLTPDQGGLTTADLGGLSPEQFRQALLDLEKRLQDIASGATDAGQASQFAVQRTITEVQANLLASLLTTGNVWAEQTARNTAAIVAALGASIPTGSIVPPATGAAATPGGLTITGGITVNITAPGMDAASAPSIGSGAAKAVAAELDAIYGAKLRTRKLLSGNVTQV